jgi:hypothetical protein
MASFCCFVARRDQIKSVNCFGLLFDPFTLWPKLPFRPLGFVFFVFVPTATMNP